MAAEKLPVIDFYSNNDRRNALLRYSLWVAGDKICYICDKALPSFRDSEIDHVLPKSEKVISKSEFERIWRRCAPGDLKNQGVHHISNLRTACRPCNRAHRKGAKVFKDRFYILTFDESAAITSKAHRAQRRLLKNNKMVESLLHVTTASTGSDYETIWDEDLRQALLDTMFEASRRSTAGTQRRELPRLELLTEVSMSADVSRTMAALHLVSGVSADTIAQCLVDEATAIVQAKFEPLVRREYLEVLGPDVGYIDWGQTVFEVSIDRVSINDDEWSCEGEVSVDTWVSAPVQVQSQDGGELENGQSADCDIEGNLWVRVAVGEGHFEVDEVGDAFNLTLR